MFNHKTIGTVILLAVGFAYAGGEELESLEVKQKAGYRIEVETTSTPDGMPIIKIKEKEKEKEIKFVSPRGKIVKTLQYDRRKDWGKIFIAPTFEYLIKSEDTPAEWGKDRLGERIKIREAKVKFSYINAKGEKKWSKEFEIIYTMEETDEDDLVPYFFKISQNGGKIVFVKVDTITWDWYWFSDIIVFDTLGNIVTSVRNAPGIEYSSDIQISPDGKIVGARVSCYVEGLKRHVPHFFLLDVETGRTKIVKAEGEVDGRKWDGGFGLSNMKSLPPSGKIFVGVCLYDAPSVKLDKIIKEVHVALTFDEIPDDLSTLLGGEK